MLVLAVDLNEGVAQPLEEADRDRRVVHERAMPAAARELAADDHLAVLEGQARLVERRHRAVRDLEDRLHRRRLGVRANHVGLSARTPKEEDRVDQNRLACAGLSGEDVEAWSEGDGKVLDDREVSDSQLTQHPPRC